MNTIAMRITDHRTGFDQTIELSQALALSPAPEIALWADDERGDSTPAVNAERFVNNGDGTITDSTTGLMWSAEDVTAERVDWAAADGACRQLCLGGHTDWRLPTRTELLSLIDDMRHAPAIDIAAFPSCKSSRYWTGTECVWDPGSAWFVAFHAGSAGSLTRTYEDALARAVRSIQPTRPLSRNYADPYAALRAAFKAGARIQAWHLNGITREYAIAIAIDAAFKHGREHSYVADPFFVPHEWVIEAILAASNGITSNKGAWEHLGAGSEPQFSCPAHLYRIHPEDLAEPDSETLIEGEGIEAIEAIQAIADKLGVPCTQEAIEEAIDEMKAAANA